ncbi:MAG TPA: DegT/DnrJ/EryC1/StrS family aminotransferase [Vicinamibacteria bacterium]|nr:DegT/DnrJ/EryC1/StrS family aminotransferase [Vicinamibacteria bacterium]
MNARPSVPMVDLKAQYGRIREEVDAAVARVLEGAQFIHGDECRLLEKEFAAYCGVAHACGVANGTDALTLAIKAYGVGPGDEVVTVANTFIATGEAILLNGAKPVFVDVDETFTLDPSRLEAAITKRSRLVVPVHLYGHPAAMAGILEIAKKHGLPVLEDAAQAHGAEISGRRAGSLAHAACFSFYPGKNLGAYGDAGMVVSGDADFIARVRQLANHGAGAHKYDNAVPGTNSRLDTLQAAVLRVKLRHLDLWNRERRARVEAYRTALSGAEGIRLPFERPEARSAWHLFTIRVQRRDALQAHLASSGISTAIHYPKPLHLQPAMAAAGGRAGDLPISETLSREVLSLPLYPELPFETLERVAQAVRAFGQDATR